MTTFIATKMIATPVLLVLSRGNRLSIHVEDLGCNFGFEMGNYLWVKIGDLDALSRMFHLYEIHFAFKLQNMLLHINFVWHIVLQHRQKSFAHSPYIFLQ